MEPQHDKFQFLIGMTEARAFEIIQEYDHLPRIVRRDTMWKFGIMGANFNRVNLEIDNNIVSTVHQG